MKLRIIEKNDNEGLLLILENNDDKKYIDIDAFDSPFTANFKQSLQRYYADRDFYSDPDKWQKTLTFMSDTVTRSLSKGQSLGDCLLDEDQTLYAWIKEIEDLGLNTLDIQIESENPTFFDEAWEYMVLPDSNYFLSASAGSFVRKIAGYDTGDSIRLNLQLPTQNLEAKSLSSEEEPQQALNVLHLLSRPNSIEMHLSVAFTHFALPFNNIPGIDYKVEQIEALEQLHVKLSAIAPQVLHLDCPIIVDKKNGNIELLLETEDENCVRLNFKSVCLALVEHKVSLLTVDSCFLTPDLQLYSSAMGLAQVAKVANNLGIGNVLGLSHQADCRLSVECFSFLYRHLTQGLSLSQAVIETRKALQKSIQTQLYSPETIAFQRWPLLQHYGGQELHYFVASQVELDSLADKTSPNNLHGFDARIFNNHRVDDACLPQIIKTLMTEDNVFLQGVEGSGKTFLAHIASEYLAQTKKITHGFYFDFHTVCYQPDVMLHMMAPIFGQGLEKTEDIRGLLNQTSCLFVLDNFYSIDMSPDEYQQLDEFTQQLTHAGHKIIVSGKNDKQAVESGYHRIAVNPLTLEQSAILSVNIAKQQQMTNADFFVRLIDVYQNTQGNPYLLRQPSFWQESQQTLVSLSGSQPAVMTYLKNTFNALSPCWQTTLILANNIEGLLFEILMIGSESKDNENPWQELLTQCEAIGLAVESKNFKIGLEYLEANGFLESRAQGRELTEQARRYLHTESLSRVLGELDEQDVRLSFSRLFSSGIRILSGHLAQQQNPELLHHLLMNRSSYPAVFEQLWFAGDHEAFMHTKNAFDKLLQQVGLISESSDWALDLLKRANYETLPDIMTGQLAWLQLSRQALAQHNALQTPCIITTTTVCSNWLTTQKESEEEHINLALFHHVILFLQDFYLKTEQWQACEDTMEFAHSLYHAKEVWHWDIQALKVLTLCYSKQGFTDKALQAEQKILTEIPYDNAPEGFKAHQEMEILLARVERKETKAAQQLLDEITSVETPDTRSLILMEIQNEVYFINQEYESCFPYYCKAWQDGLSQNNPNSLVLLKARFEQIATFFGETVCRSKFNAICEPDIQFPLDYVGDIPSVH